MLRYALFFTFVATGYALTCYEGLDLSIGGIPLYHWAERECEINDVCVLQEISSPLIDDEMKAEVRYGGCVSREYSKFLTCDELFGVESTLTMPTFLDLVYGLDKKFQLLVLDFLLDYDEQHITKLFSRGKDSSEFLEGLLIFLEKIGFDAKKYRKELESFVQSASKGDVKIAIAKFLIFLDSAAVSDKHVKSLYKSTRDFLTDVLDGPIPSDIDTVLKYATWIIYSISTKYDFNLADNFDMLSEELEELDIDEPYASLAKDDAVKFLSYLGMLQVLVGDMSSHNEYRLYNFMKKILHVYNLKYPDEKILQIKEKFISEFHKNIETMNSLFPCKGNLIDCISTERLLFFEKIHSSIHQMTLEILQKEGYHLTEKGEIVNLQKKGEISTSQKEGGRFSAWREVAPYIKELRKIMKDFRINSLLTKNNPTLEDFIDSKRSELIKVTNGWSPDIKRKIRQLFAPESRKHYECESDLCNDINKDHFSGRKDEL